MRSLVASVGLSAYGSIVADSIRCKHSFPTTPTQASSPFTLLVMAPYNGKRSGKRKLTSASGPGTDPANDRLWKRPKHQDARRIGVQTTEEAFKNGELDVDRFIQARQWEIRALEASMKGAKLVYPFSET